MHTTDRRRQPGRLLALISAALLVAAAVAFAPSASAKAHSGSPSNAAPGHARHHANAGTSHRRSHARGGRSAVSLPRPNSFQAQADPDGMLNGGVDQPGGTGGIDTRFQDGNNGSGNDVDCEDDNRGVGVPGHCRNRPVGSTPGTSTTGTTQSHVPMTVVEAPQASTPATVAVSSPTAPRVILAGRSPSTTALPNMGADAGLLTMTLAGLAAIVVGAALCRRGVRRRA